MTDKLQDLTRPFPRYVHKNPSGGGTYVKHHVVNQRLIEVFRHPPNFKLVEIIRGDVAEVPPNPDGSSKRAKEGAPALTNVIVGVVAQLSLIGLSFEDVTIEEVGDCEDPHNWKTDGARLKDAMSDAYKRCAMRLGCGLHLWSGDEYFLHDQLVKRSGAPTGERAGSTEVEPKGDEAAATAKDSPSPHASVVEPLE